MWISSIRVLRRYADERFAWGQFLSMALFLVLASLAAGRKTSVLGLTLELALACSFLFQFRLWDDLADRAIDRLDHPERFLAQARSVRIFEWFTAVLGLLNFGFIAALRSHPVPLTTWVALNLGFLGWYAWRPDPAIHRLLNAHVILLKYPAFVLLLASVACSRSPSVWFISPSLPTSCCTIHCCSARLAPVLSSSSKCCRCGRSASP
jgi:4-hydroxybenzoate polyprenyltransferase